METHTSVFNDAVTVHVNYILHSADQPYVFIFLLKQFTSKFNTNVTISTVKSA